MECEGIELARLSKDEAVGQGLVQRSITEDYKTSMDEVLASALLGSSSNLRDATAAAAAATWRAENSVLPLKLHKNCGERFSASPFSAEDPNLVRRPQLLQQ